MDAHCKLAGLPGNLINTNECFSYVGAQNGIYEFQINAQGRKYYPSIKLS